jgi:hypothetical protein
LRGDSVPEADHVSRYCPKRHIDEGRITGAAFQLRGATERREAETYISVNWLELLCLPDRESEIAEVRRVLGNKLSMHKRDKIVVGLVGKIIENVFSGTRPDSRQLRVTHEPEVDDPSHSGIRGLREDDDLLFGELIAAVCQETYPARS